MSDIRSNVLVLSAGRRVELVRLFQKSIATSIGSGSVFATDMVPERSSACHVANGAFEVPRATEPDYVDRLVAICAEHDIGLVVPTIDPELELLASEKGRFDEQGSNLIISDPSLVSVCRDKRETGKLFKSLGIGYPEIYDPGDLVFPCFCKPYDGSRSIGAKVIESEAAVLASDLTNSRNMFMEYVPKSYVEYTVDGYYDRGHRLRALVCRERLEVRSGEVSKGITRKNFAYEFLVERLQTLPGAVGCITFQFFVNPETEDIKGLEINPRFGGGFPLTHASGAPFTDYLIREYFFNEVIAFNNEWEDGLMMLRYDAGVYVSSGN